MVNGQYLNEVEKLVPFNGPPQLAVDTTARETGLHCCAGLSSPFSPRRSLLGAVSPMTSSIRTSPLIRSCGDSSKTKDLSLEALKLHHDSGFREGDESDPF